MRWGLLWLGLLAGPALAQESITAVLEPAESVELRPIVAGRLQAVLVAEGAEVSEGQTLVQLNDAQQRQRVALAETVVGANGQIRRAEAQVKQAQSLAARVSRARARGAAQAWEVEQANQAVALAQAEVTMAQDAQAQAKAQLALEQSILADYQLTAPFDGIVLEQPIDRGASLDPQTVVMTLGQIDQLEATGFVPVDWLPALEAAQSLPAVVAGLSEQETTVTVAAIDPRIDPASRTLRVTFRLDNAAGAFRPGATLIVNRP